MILPIDYTSPSTQFTFDVNTSPLFKKDNQNYINILGTAQLNTLENVSLLDIFLSTNNVVEPHYHQNAGELVYCISGAATVSLLNPFTKQIQNYPIKFWTGNKYSTGLVALYRRECRQHAYTRYF
ncbi:hypothetical protein LSPH24S_08450 [Lysinibacillus sphaericus]